MEKQKVLLEELHRKLDLDLDNFNKLEANELKEIVHRAVGSVSNFACSLFVTYLQTSTYIMRYYYYCFSIAQF